MLSSTLAFLALSGSTLSLALPVTTSNSVGQRFTVEAFKNPKHVVSVARDKQRIAQKFGGFPQYVQKRGTNGTQPANAEQYEAAYVCPVSIGGQTLNLDFDTGSSDLWVFSTELSSADQAGHNNYDPTKSTPTPGKAMSGAAWSIQYADGSTSSGDVYTDSVTVGGLTFDTQAVELAKTVSSGFSKNKFSDGLLGLAFSSLNTVTPKSQLTFYDNIVSQLDQQLFTVDLKHGTAKSSYDFGYIDAAKHSEPIKYAPLTNSQGGEQKWYEFATNKYQIDNGPLLSSPSNAIADTGTTLLYVTQQMATSYYAKVKGVTQESGTYVFPCSTVLPNITLSIGSEFATVPGSLLKFDVGDPTTCIGGVQVSTSPVLIYGDVFLKAVLAVFDSGNKRFGFAKKDIL